MSINVWFFLHKSQFMSTSKLCVSIDAHFCVCMFLRVKSVKLAKTLSNIYIEGWYAGEDEMTINYCIQVGVLRRLPKKLDLQRTPLQKKCRHVGIHVIFSSMYYVLHQRALGRIVNHH